LMVLRGCALGAFETFMASLRVHTESQTPSPVSAALVTVKVEEGCQSGALSRSALVVSCVRPVSLVVASITKMSGSPPSRSLVKATFVPSGENAGSVSLALLLVKRVGVPEPSAFIAKTSKSLGSPAPSRLLVKAIFEPLGEKLGALSETRSFEVRGVCCVPSGFITKTSWSPPSRLLTKAILSPWAE
jgi:hypothetical protein